MISFPNCKINLGLTIVGKRNDGFHNLETIFYPIALKDVLEIIQAENFTIKTTGIPIDGNSEKNLCVKAYQLLRQKFDLPPIYMHLHKTIPLGAGLGGGSSDGAAALLLLNQKFQLGLTQNELLDLALQLGSDCPFFILNQPCLATGRGEKLHPLQIPELTGLRIVIINPGIHINTGWAFSQIKTAPASASLQSIISKPVAEWKNTLRNDFEQAVFTTHPEIKIIKEELYNKGALYAAMSGSGASVFGIFEKNAHPSFNFPNHYFIHQSEAVDLISDI